MISLFGKGPLILKRSFHGERYEATYDYHISKVTKVVLQVKNKGKINQNGQRMDKYTGAWYYFTLTITDPPVEFGGTGGQNHLIVFNMIKAMLGQPHSNQFIRCIPANSMNATTEFACKFASEEIPVNDLCSIAGAGQSISLNLVTMNLDPDFMFNYYTDPDDDGRIPITDQNGDSITDHEGAAITGF